MEMQKAKKNQDHLEDPDVEGHLIYNKGGAMKQLGIVIE